MLTGSCCDEPDALRLFEAVRRCFGAWLYDEFCDDDALAGSSSVKSTTAALFLLVGILKAEECGYV